MKCPNCNSENIRYRENRHNYICDDCDYVFVEEAHCPQRIFVSYGHDEFSGFIIKLSEILKQKGWQVFIDTYEIREGRQWENCLESGLKWTKEAGDKGTFLLIMTPYSVRRPDGYCLNEIAYAIDLGLKILPVMAMQVTPPLSIYRLQYLNMPIDSSEVQSEDFLKSYSERIIKAIEDIDTLGKDGYNIGLMKDLKPLDFNSEIINYSQGFIGREWVFDYIKDWLKTKGRTLLITGMPGIGKTAISTYLYHKIPNILAFYMFRRDDNEKLSLKSFVTTLAYQIATQIPDYRESLMKMDIDHLLVQHEGVTLFIKLITDPLSRIDIAEEKTLLIDGLDEAERNGQNAMASIIAMCTEHFPEWLHIIILSRPVNSVLIPFSFAHKIEITADGKDNLSDLKAYIKKRLPDITEEKQSLIVERSEGSFLYAKYACNNALSGLEINLPYGMSQFYYCSFCELYPNESEYASKARPFLEWLVASPYPLSQIMLMSLASCDHYEIRSFKNQMKAFLQISAEGKIRLYHSSLSDWLLDENLSGLYWVSVNEARKKMVSFVKQLIKDFLWSFKGLEDFKNKRNLLEEKIGMKVDEPLFMLYLDLLESEKDWHSFIDFSIWYIGQVPAFTYEIRDRISVLQDKYYEKFEIIGGNQILYDAWEKRMIEYIEESTERTVINKDPSSFYERPITRTCYIYFLKDHCVSFLRTNLSSKSLETRCLVTKRAFEHMQYDFIHYYSLHEDSICSFFVDDLRNLFYNILQTGKIKNKDIIKWLEQYAKEDKVFNK